MAKLLIFIGENQKFDVEATVGAITALDGTTNAKRGDFIGAIFECEYSYGDRSTIIRISPNAETITAVGLGDDALSFALEIQRALPFDLNAIDLDYSFNVPLRNFHSIEQLKQAISA